MVCPTCTAKAPPTALDRATWVLDEAYDATGCTYSALPTAEAQVAYIRGLIAAYRQYSPRETP